MAHVATTGTRDVTEEPYQSGPRGWLLRAFPEASQSNIFLRAVLYSSAILAIEYLIEVVWLGLPYWQQYESFLADPGVPLSAIGLVFTLVLLGQWGQRYIELWARVRPAFDVSPERYQAVVHGSLDGLYGRDHVPFVLFAGVQISVYALLGPELPAGYLHVGFLHFFTVMAIYSFYQHTVTIRRVGALDLVDVARARPTLSEVADFSVVVCLNWFAALSALVVYVGLVVGLERDLGLFYAATVLVLVVVGLLVFVIPLVLLHETLARAKQKRLQAVTAEYEALFDAWKTGELERDPAVGLEILETRRRNVESVTTWPYRLVSVGKVTVASVVPTLLSVVQTLGP